MKENERRKFALWILHADLIGLQFRYRVASKEPIVEPGSEVRAEFFKVCFRA
jgi:hypothetical protein